jgi:hypothetical protein
MRPSRLIFLLAVVLEYAVVHAVYNAQVERKEKLKREQEVSRTPPRYSAIRSP